ncbi:MAG TPA: transcriptional regulator [Acetobacteraceae bacterium]|nr:transcriptional regulator [Acetobacteraceae bacterium]
MALTRSFRDLVQHRVANDPGFGREMLREAIACMLAGDLEAGKALLRDYIKATLGFEKLGMAVGAQPKSLIRMFGPRGNPQARNLFRVIGYLQKQAGMELSLVDKAASARPPGAAGTRRAPHSREKPSCAPVAAR